MRSIAMVGLGLISGLFATYSLVVVVPPLFGDGLLIHAGADLLILAFLVGSPIAMLLCTYPDLDHQSPVVPLLREHTAGSGSLW